MARQVGYILDADPGNETVVVGTRLFSQGTMHYRVATRFESDSASGEGLTSRKKWGGLRTLEKTDLTQWTSMGPISLGTEDSTVFAIAVVSGTSVDDFLGNADRALALWQSITVSREENDRGGFAHHGWELSAPYPHPVVFPLQLRFWNPRQSLVELTVFDLLGRQIMKVVDGHYAPGQHTATWDGLCESRTPVASGLYIVRMMARNDYSTILRSQPILIAH